MAEKLIHFRGLFLNYWMSLKLGNELGSIKRIWYLSPMRAAKVQASLRIRAVSPEPPLLAHTSSESRGTFRQKARSLVPLNGWACAVKICHDRMLEDTNSLDGAQLIFFFWFQSCCQEVHSKGSYSDPPDSEGKPTKILSGKTIQAKGPETQEN